MKDEIREHGGRYADIPSKPCPECGNILVTGASGYIGGRLVPVLLERGYKVRIMVRSSPLTFLERWPGVKVSKADALKKETLSEALEGVYAAYYLIHSLQLGPRGFEAADIEGAENFRRACEEMGVKRIIYLGGLGDINTKLSAHLRSRMEVAKELQRGKASVTCLRAAMIIGSGSASYEIIKDLVSRLPFAIMPVWANNKCQPVAIRDVIKYLVGVLEVPETAGRYFDIGGPEIFTYGDLIRRTAKILGRKIRFYNFHIPSVRFYGYMASLVTAVPASLVISLFDGLRNDVICQQGEIREYLDFSPISYEDALGRALTYEEDDHVDTRWSDAYPPEHDLARKLSELEYPPGYTKSYSLITEKSACSIFNSMCRIGGKEGYFNNNWMWRLRALADRLLLGAGGFRGRRRYSTPVVNDVIDFWRVEDVRHCKRLLLRAEMKLPGIAWLELGIEKEGRGTRLLITSWYDTDTFAGKLYWYIFLPFHRFIFKNLIVDIEKRSN